MDDREEDERMDECGEAGADMAHFPGAVGSMRHAHAQEGFPANCLSYEPLAGFN
jgi:hypothetical protein